MKYTSTTLNLFSDWKFLIIIVAILLLFASVNALLIGITLTSFIILYLLFDNKFLLFFIIVAFLLPTEKISPFPRLLVQFISYSIVTYLFLKHYGLKFSKYPKLPANFKYFIFSLLLLMLISSFNSNQMLLGFKQIVTSILFFYLIYGLFAQLNSDSDVNLFLYAIITCAFLSSLVIWWEAIKFQFDFLNMYHEIFTREAFIGKNNVGVIFSITLIFITSLSFAPKFQKRRKYFFAFLLFLLIGLLVTDSRASILSLLVGLSVIIYIINKRAFLIGLSATIFITIILVFTPFWENILLYLRVDSLGTGREFLITSTIEVIKHNLVLGAGPAGTKYQIYTYLPYLLNTPAEWLIAKIYGVGDANKTHNFYLYFFSDMGIGGFLLALSLPVIYFKNCIKILKIIHATHNINYYMVIGLIGSGIFIFTRGLFEQMNIITYGHIYYDLPFWLLMSILAYYYNLYVKVN